MRNALLRVRNKGTYVRNKGTDLRKKGTIYEICLQTLWSADSGIQAAYKRRAEFQLNDSAE